MASAVTPEWTSGLNVALANLANIYPEQYKYYIDWLGNLAHENRQALQNIWGQVFPEYRAELLAADALGKDYRQRYANYYQTMRDWLQQMAHYNQQLAEPWKQWTGQFMQGPAVEWRLS